MDDMPFTKLPAPLAEALTARGYEKPTPVQASVIEQEAQGRDLVVSASTGSGKTVAFGAAMAEQILRDDGMADFGLEPLALIIAPTRELALQVSRELMWLYAKTGAKIATCVGGMDASKERRSLGHGAQIVVGTPGRLRDHFERGALDLSKLRVAVLDEADEMLDMGFREDLEEILDATPDERRTLLFSATMPKAIVALAKRYQKNALRISTVGDDRGHGDINYQAVTVSPSDIEHAAINLLRFHEAETAMLFCATRDNVRHLHSSLVERGFGAVALSGEHSQSERNHALQALRDRRARVCVATDVAARGIDLPSLSLVIHVEMPRDAETLQHRSGRTGRAGKKGTAVLLVPYPRRRRAESLLRDAKINAEWIEAPTREDIRTNDRERLIASLMEPVELDDDDRKLAATLQEKRSADEIAGLLVRAYRAKMPEPEELIDNKGPAKREGPRAGFEDTVWFKMNIGRDQNADPRWIMPLLCRRGHITRTDIGAIRITNDETMFEVPRVSAERFIQAVERTAQEGGEENDVSIVKADGPPPPQKGARRDGPPRKGRDRFDNDDRGGKRGGSGGYKAKPRGGDDRAGKSGRSFGDKPRSDKPRSDKPRGDKPRGDRPFGEKPYGDRPKSDRAKTDRPYGDRPLADRPRSDKPREDRPRESRQDDSAAPRAQLSAAPRSGDNAERLPKRLRKDGDRRDFKRDDSRGAPRGKKPFGKGGANKKPFAKKPHRKG
jgi:ATP-dependent RNA helicase DeaD